MEPPYSLKILLQGTQKLLSIVDEKLESKNDNVRTAWQTVKNALENPGESNLEALVDYKLTLDSIFIDDDDISHPNLSDFNPPSK